MKITNAEIEAAAKQINSGAKLAHVAEGLGISRQGLYKRIWRLGILLESKRAVLEVACSTCGKTFRRQRCHVRHSRRSYCGSECYMEAIRRPEYRQNRNAQRRARAIVRHHYPLLETEVVHHIDGDSSNNDVNNLMVFRDQADHMRWHRGGGAESGVVPRWSRGYRLTTVPA